MISKRTALLLALMLILAVAVGWTLHRQHERCASIARPGARRTPIAGASNRSDIVGCRDVPHFATPVEQATEVVAYIVGLALLRSLWMDRAMRRGRG